MDRTFHSSLILNHLPFEAPLLNQCFPCFYPPPYYCPLQQLPYNFTPYSFYQPMPFIQQHKNDQMLFEKTKEQEDALIAQNTTRYIADCKQTIQMSDEPKFEGLDKETLKKYIVLIIDEDDTIHHLFSHLREKNQGNLSRALETLEKKQKQQCKSREELIKFCLRKAFRYIFKCIQKQTDQPKTNLKIARQLFQTKIEEERNKKLVLPFRKNSKNKTMNNDFLKEIFSSSIFLNFYKDFLNHLNEELENDRNHKMQKLLDKIWDSLKDTKQAFIDIKRLPWSIKNTEKVKQLARELLAFSQLQ